MLRALNTAQSQSVEARAVREAGVALSELMEAAGGAVAREVARRAPDGKIVVLAGSGNNGGDGWVAALELHRAGREVVVLSVAEPAARLGIAADAARRTIEAGVEFVVPGDSIDAVVAEAAVVVDALLGTGTGLPLRDPLPAWCRAANRSSAAIVSVDLPTGVDADGGGCSEEAIRADCTVTFTAPKLGLVLFPSAACAGEIIVADIGIPADFARIGDAPELWTRSDYADLIPLPAVDTHKNRRGSVLVIAGSGFYPGAAVLAARGAMRSGAGYVTLAVPEPVVAVAQSHLLSAPVVGLPAAGRVFSSAAAAAARDLAAEYDAVVLGPGITVADGAAATARRLVAGLDKPLVIDADALNAFVDHVGLLEARSAPTVLTPHPGELGRLLDRSTAEIQSARLSSSARLAGVQRAVVLKGAGTVTSCGQRQVINTSGSPALATAGTGDVLAGVIGALLAQGLPPLEAGALGAYIHGRAGEAAAAELTPVCVTSEDIPEFLPAAFAAVLEQW